MGRLWPVVCAALCIAFSGCKTKPTPITVLAEETDISTTSESLEGWVHGPGGGVPLWGHVGTTFLCNPRTSVDIDCHDGILVAAALEWRRSLPNSWGPWVDNEGPTSVHVPVDAGNPSSVFGGAEENPFPLTGRVRLRYVWGDQSAWADPLVPGDQIEYRWRLTWKQDKGSANSLYIWHPKPSGKLIYDCPKDEKWPPLPQDPVSTVSPTPAPCLGDCIFGSDVASQPHPPHHGTSSNKILKWTGIPKISTESAGYMLQIRRSGGSSSDPSWGTPPAEANQHPAWWIAYTALPKHTIDKQLTAGGKYDWRVKGACLCDLDGDGVSTLYPGVWSDWWTFTYEP